MLRTLQGSLLEIVSEILVCQSHKSVVFPFFQICGLWIGPPLLVNENFEFPGEGVF